MTGDDRGQPRNDALTPGEVAWILGVAACLAFVAWVVPVVVVLVHSGRIPSLGLIRAVAAGVRLIGGGHTADPARAYPRDVRHLMPEAATWWTVALGTTVLLIAAVGYTWRRVEPAIARDVLGRRPYDIRGSRPRAWARGRDLPRGRGFSLGRLDGRKIRADEEAHVAVIAPTRSGKTTRCVIPWLLEHPGPAIVTSTKRDVLDATVAWRSRIGQVWVYDPFARESARWSPLIGCENWSHAMRQAQWLADATQGGDSEIARYWRGEAAKLLAPLLHAAALERVSMTHVLAWLDVQDVRQPSRMLLAAGAAEAERQLQAVALLDGRNKGTTYMSAGSVLQAFRFPEVLGATGPMIVPAAFHDGAPHTLYVVAPERHQELLTPLIVGLLLSLLHERIERTTHSPRLRVLLDEASNIAPLRDLPRLLSQAAGHGIRVATVWQSLAQMHAAYGASADTILANSNAKLFMGPITDHATRGYVSELLGWEAGQHNKPKANSAALQQLTDRALLISGAAPPTVVFLRPWWRSRRLARHALAVR
jgi:type IV secretion system protein VirD4